MLNEVVARALKDGKIAAREDFHLLPSCHDRAAWDAVDPETRAYYAGAAEADDLLSVGSIGLIKAINTYEPNKGTQLATYTAKCIENEILMLLRANKKFKNNVSLSEVVGTDKDGNELMLIDLLCEKDDSVFQKVEKAIQNEKFTELVRAVLTEREFKIITLRYGLKGGRCHPQREVALLMRISRSYVSRIEKKAVEKLKAAVKKEDFYL